MSPTTTISKEIAELLDSLSNQTHAATAILRAGFVERVVTHRLKHKMRPLTRKQERRLFAGYGPLSSFASRVDVAYAFNILDDQLYRDINTIRDIRNRFAHMEALTTFETPEIIDLCKKLSYFTGEKTDFLGFYDYCIGQILAKLAETSKVDTLYKLLVAPDPAED